PRGEWVWWATAQPHPPPFAREGGRMGKPLSIVVAFVLALSVTACGSNAGSGDDTGGDGASSSDPSSFPVTVEGTNGQVKIDERPERIVSLSPTPTEELS